MGCRQRTHCKHQVCHVLPAAVAKAWCQCRTGFPQPPQALGSTGGAARAPPSMGLGIAPCDVLVIGLPGGLRPAGGALGCCGELPCQAAGGGSWAPALVLLPACSRSSCSCRCRAINSSLAVASGGTAARPRPGDRGCRPVIEGMRLLAAAFASSAEIARAKRSCSSSSTSPVTGSWKRRRRRRRWLCGLTLAGPKDVSRRLELAQHFVHLTTTGSFANPKRHWCAKRRSAVPVLLQRLQRLCKKLWGKVVEKEGKGHHLGGRSGGLVSNIPA